MDRQAYLFLLQRCIALDDFRKVIGTIELSDYRAFGLLSLRTIGSSDYRAFGLLGLRTIGPTPIIYERSDYYCLYCEVSYHCLKPISFQQRVLRMKTTTS
jgi:hypothetical protein